MSDSFAIGEVAQLYRPESSWHLEEVRITSGLLPPVPYMDSHTGAVTVEPIYLVECLFAVETPPMSGWAVPPRWLRKKPPPVGDTNKLGEWALCPFQPSGVKESA